MDTKITKKRLNDHFSYDWVKYVALIVATVFLFWFLYDVGATRATTAQTFELYMVNTLPVESNSEKVQNGFRAVLSGEPMKDEKGNAVFSKDEILECMVSGSTYSNYSADSQIQQALSVKLMGGHESDMLLMNYATYNNFAQTWLLSMDDYLAQVKIAIEEHNDLIGNTKDYPDVPDGSSADAIKRMKERQVWDGISEGYAKLLPKLETYGYRYNKIKTEEGLKEWEKISNQFMADIKTLDKDKDKVKYQALKEKFDADYLAIVKIHGEGEKFWGLDFGKRVDGKEVFDRQKIKKEWFSAQSDYLRNWGDEEDTGLYFAIGITNFGSYNGDTYFELVKALNHIIDTYAAQ